MSSVQYLGLKMLTFAVQVAGGAVMATAAPMLGAGALAALLFI